MLSSPRGMQVLEEDARLESEIGKLRAKRDELQRQLDEVLVDHTYYTCAIRAMRTSCALASHPSILAVPNSV